MRGTLGVLLHSTISCFSFNLSQASTLLNSNVPVALALVANATCHRRLSDRGHGPWPRVLSTDGAFCDSLFSTTTMPLES
ncbi:hypothetical protein BC835DRAFT_1019260 [Cytidiella melzeri]|nr:hypothetical protein BC835DRAFT_1019260 [Cytidiella melzeri]